MRARARELWKFMAIWLSVIAFGSMFTGGALTWLSQRARALGDINGDGVVNILDVKRVKMAYSDLVEEPRADIDGDGVVNILDLKKMKLIYSETL